LLSLLLLMLMLLLIIILVILWWVGRCIPWSRSSFWGLIFTLCSAMFDCVDSHVPYLILTCEVPTWIVFVPARGSSSSLLMQLVLTALWNISLGLEVHPMVQKRCPRSSFNLAAGHHVFFILNFTVRYHFFVVLLSNLPDAIICCHKYFEVRIVILVQCFVLCRRPPTPYFVWVLLSPIGWPYMKIILPYSYGSYFLFGVGLTLCFVCTITSFVRFTVLGR